MKYNIFITILLTIVFLGCDPHKRFGSDNEPPTVPSGLTSLALDRQVELWWDENPENDVAGYNIYSATSAGGRYRLIGTSRTPQYVDRYLSNGTTYYYAISAYDESDNESELTGENVYSIPRPEGFDLALFDYRQYPNTSGYDFSTNTFGKYDDKYTDIFFENDNGAYYMDVWTDSDIQDMGYTSGLDDITIAPVDGWSPSKDVRLIKGHTYIVWTWDDHYAKFRVYDIKPDHVLLDWAYQLVIGNPNLKHQKTATGDRLPLNPGKPLQ
jgi:hypothetical protein